MDYVIDWVKHLYFDKNIRQVNIIDDNFTFHIDYAKEFCNRIIELNLKGLTLFTPNEIRVQKTDEELLRLMKKAGAPQTRQIVSLARSGASMRSMRRCARCARVTQFCHSDRIFMCANPEPFCSHVINQKFGRPRALG